MMIIHQMREGPKELPSLGATLEAIGLGALSRRLERARVWRREFARVRGELQAYSDRELAADLRIARGTIDDLAAQAADERLADFVRAHPEHRGAGRWRREAAAAG